MTVMKKSVNIDNRTYSQLEEYCKVNKINIQEYLSDSIKNQLYIDIYGDMNQMRGNETIKKELTEVKKEKHIEIWSDINEIILNNETNEIILIDKEDKKYKYDSSILKIVEKTRKEEFINDNVIENKPIRIKRQIQTR